MTKKLFLRTIAGNLPFCRTEAEISDEAGNLLCVVYKDKEGWHIELRDVEGDQDNDDFAATVSDAKSALTRYINTGALAHGKRRRHCGGTANRTSGRIRGMNE